MVDKPSRKSPFAFKPVIIKPDSTKRRIIKQLPAVHQTETLQKFFGSTVDQLFNPGKANSVNGYVGQYPIWHDPSQDFYLSEQTSSRGFYQLEPTMVSKDVEGNIKSLLFYPDLINQLRFQGALTNNHNRLFEQEFYTWCPPVDLDKVLNFRQYYWLSDFDDVPPVAIIGPKATYIARGPRASSTPYAPNQFPLPFLEEDGTSEIYDVSAIGGQHRVYVDGVQHTLSNSSGVANRYSYNSTTKRVTITPTPAEDAVVEVYAYTDFDSGLIDKTTSELDFRMTGGIELTSGMRIVIQMDANSTYNDNIYIVESLGTGLRLIEDNSPDASLEPDYLVMARGCRDGNPWSTKNRWFHKATLPADVATQLESKAAKRPIIEMGRDLELYNYGNLRRASVDFVCEELNDAVGGINGRTTALSSIDGLVINVAWIQSLPGDTARVLVKNANNGSINNQIYLINIVGGLMKMSLETDGIDPNGLAVLGEVISVNYGEKYAGTELYWDGQDWAPAQVKEGPNSFPLFNLYDVDGVSLSDEGSYPGTNFTGSRLFSYREDITGARGNDSVLGFPVIHDNTGQILLENYRATQRFTYKINQESQDIVGFHFHGFNTEDESLNLSNDWHATGTNSRQMILDRFIGDGYKRLFTLSQEIASSSNGIPNLIVTRGRQDELSNFTTDELILGVDYLHDGQNLLLVEVREGDVIDARTFNPANPPVGHQGFYEIPLNLQANPDNDEIDYLGKGDYFSQFADIIKSQNGFKGAVYDNNNWRDTAQDLTLGRSIVQHSASLLKTMLLASSSNLDIVSACRYVEGEYTRFRAKFEQKLTEYLNAGKLDTADTLEKIVNTILDDINRGKTKSFPFYYSGMAMTSGQLTSAFIPASPSFLGVYPCFKPVISTDTSLSEPQNFIIGHDGSMTLSYGDIRDQLLLTLETRIYNSIDASIRTADRPAFDVVEWVESQFRNGDYTGEEFLRILQPSFERWTAANGLDYRTNDTFDVTNPFTWNWSSVSDTQTERNLPGHWRAIYQLFYDTARPHTHPWEMLGFVDKPEWWDSRYGAAPYTKNNFILWRDLEKGFVFQGPRQGINPKWAREGLSTFIPVDVSGALLDPYAAGIARTQPTSASARKDWAWGDMGPVETAWRRSSSYGFAIAQVGYLMKPARFMEISWDTSNNARIQEGTANEQFVNRDTNNRSRNSAVYVHGETVDDLVVTHVGIQQWVSDSLISKNADVTESFGDLVRGLDVQLAYKVGGFTDATTLNVVSDSFDRIPNEDVKISLYRSPSVREEFYGGVIIEFTGAGWRVFGYDVVNPYFSVIAPDVYSSSRNIGVGSAPQKTSSWKGGIYYSINNVIEYRGNFYQCLKTHTSSKQFEPSYWNIVARPSQLATNNVQWYSQGVADLAFDTVPYGTTFRGLQDVVNFINGYQRAMEARGWVFEDSLSGEGDSKDWETSAVTFLTWHEAGQESGNFIALSPSSSMVKFRTEQGAIQPVEQIINGVYSLVDRQGRPIDSQKTRVVRNDGEITITPTGVAGGIFGVRLYVSEIEHVVVLNNKTIFNDTVYNPLLNIRQPRVRLQGFRTLDWKGRIDAPGFIISNNTLTPNFERCADDFRRIFDIEGLENKNLQERARANVGYQERDYLTNLMLTPTNQFEFYQGMIQQKGTPTVMRRLLRSNFIRNNKDLNFFEEWAFRTGDYGSSDMRPSFELQLLQKDFTNNPQLIEFNSIKVDDILTVSQTATTFDSPKVLLTATAGMKVLSVRVNLSTQLGGTFPEFSIGTTANKELFFKTTNASSTLQKTFDLSLDPVVLAEGDVVSIHFYNVTSGGSITATLDYQIPASQFLSQAEDDQYDHILSISDIFSQDSSRYLYKDTRWVRRQDAKDLVWPTRQFRSFERALLPNAGYVSVDEVQWTVKDNAAFIDLFNAQLAANPPKEIKQTIDFTYDGTRADAFYTDHEILSNATQGVYRIKTITARVDEAFVADSALITVTGGNGDVYATFGTDSDDRLQIVDLHEAPQFIYIKNGSGNSAVTVRFAQLARMAAVGANIGKVSITLEAELLSKSVLPNQRAWVYGDLDGGWNTYKLSDTGFNVQATYGASHNSQGTVIALDSPLDGSLSFNTPVFLDGVQRAETNYALPFRPKMENQARFIIDGKTDATTPLMAIPSEAGLVINKITINVIKPFTGGTVPPTVCIGTLDEPEYFVKTYQKVDSSNAEIYSNTDAPRPSFTYGQPIELNVFDATLSAPEGASTIAIEVTRGGNIYLTPSHIVVTNPGSGYTSAPLVTVTGPEGVRATATLAGGVDEIIIVNGGKGYTGIPTITFVSDTGSGATAVVQPADLVGGKIKAITITNPGVGYTIPPRVVISGGGGTEADAEALLNLTIRDIKIIALGNCNYSGSSPAVVTITGGGISEDHGTQATATLVMTPSTLVPTTFKWRYRRTDNGNTAWTTPGSNTIAFNLASDPGSDGKSHWRKVVDLPIPTSVDENQVFEVEIYDAVNGSIANDTATVNLINTTLDSRSADLTTPGCYVIPGMVAPVLAVDPSQDSNIPNRFNGYSNFTGSNQTLGQDIVDPETQDIVVFLDANGAEGLVTVVVDYHYTNGFELFDEADQPATQISMGRGGDVLTWVKTRFANEASLLASNPPGGWVNGDIVEVDATTVNTDLGWAVFKRTGNAWIQIRTENAKVDSSQLVSATIYNNKNNEVMQTLQLYDPYKGIIPGAADREIHYKTIYDPAIYTDSEDLQNTVDAHKAWGSDQVGRLWWNLGTTYYLDYEMGTTEYRWKNWGKLAPSVTIDIYEWVRSPVAPSQWNQYVSNITRQNPSRKLSGQVIDTSRGWVERIEWDPEVQKNNSFYYFWIKDVVNVPTGVGRKLSSVQVANIIQDPIANDIPYVAVIDANKIIVGGIKQYLNDTDTVLKFNWVEDTNDTLHHKQWMIIREGDERNSIDSRLWTKLRDSVIGWDEFSTARLVKNITLQTLFDFEATSVTVSDASKLKEHGEVRIGDHWFSYEWKDGNVLHGIKNETDDFVQIGEPVEQFVTLSAPRQIPDPILTPAESIGTQVRPRQSWFSAELLANGQKRVHRDARKMLIESINAIFSEQAYVDIWYDWQNVFEATDRLPEITAYSELAQDLDYRNALATESRVAAGQRVLLEGIEEYQNFWTLWRYDPSHPKSDDGGFVLEDAQKWRMQQGEMWDRVDWYAAGWSASDFPNYRFENRSAFEAAKTQLTLDVTLLRGTLVHIDQPTGWTWEVFGGSGWEIVAKQNGTFKLNSHFYNPDKVTYGYGTYDLTSIANRDGSWELQWVLNKLYNELLTKKQINQVFFDMVKAALGMSSEIDWTFKTSYLYLGGYSETLRQSPLAFKDQIDNVVSYLQEVKPYHVTIRDYVRRLSTGPDLAVATVMDFDKPVYPYIDQVLGTQFKVLKTDAPEMQTGIWKNWSDNYEKTNRVVANWAADWNPVRHSKVKVLFDRIALENTSGWDSQPWDSSEEHYTGTVNRSEYSSLISQADPYADKVVRTMDERNLLVRKGEIDNGTIVTVLRDDTKWLWLDEEWTRIWAVSWDIDWGTSMVDRINQYYEPKLGMKRKSTQQLLKGAQFRGTTIEGGQMDYGVWDIYMWDFESGWANEDNYIRSIDSEIQDRPFPSTLRTQGQTGEQALPLVDVNGDGLVEVPVINPHAGTNSDESETNPNVYEDGSILVDGNEFSQPEWNEGHPDELLRIRSRSPMALNVYQTTGNGRSQTAAFRMFQNGQEKWEMTRIEEESVTVFEDVPVQGLGEPYIVLQCPSATFPFHNPESPTAEYLDSLKLAVVDMGLSQEEIDELLGRQHPGVIWIGNERISYWGVEALASNKFKLTGIRRGAGATSRGAAFKDKKTWINPTSAMTYAFTAHSGWVSNSSDVRVALVYTGTNLPTYHRRLNLNVDYTISGLDVTFVEAPLSIDAIEGYTLSKILVIVRESDWTNQLVMSHKVGAKVYDGSVIQNLPMNNQNLAQYPTDGQASEVTKMLADWQVFLAAGMAGPVK
jgi:hypothetical protein